MDDNCNLHYIVRTGTSSRITDIFNQPLIVASYRVKDEIKRANDEHPLSTYESISVADFKKKYQYLLWAKIPYNMARSDKKPRKF